MNIGEKIRNAKNKVTDFFDQLMIEAQHGNKEVINDYSLFDKACEIIEVKYLGEKPCYIQKVEALTIGEAAMMLTGS